MAAPNSAILIAGRPGTSSSSCSSSSSLIIVYHGPTEVQPLFPRIHPHDTWELNLRRPILVLRILYRVLCKYVMKASRWSFMGVYFFRLIVSRPEGKERPNGGGIHEGSLKLFSRAAHLPLDDAFYWVTRLVINRGNMLFELFSCTSWDVKYFTGRAEYYIFHREGAGRRRRKKNWILKYVSSGRKTGRKIISFTREHTSIT